MLDVTDKDGSTSITLKCPKFQEAITFACVGTGLYDAFERLNELRIPVHIIAGGTSHIKYVLAFLCYSSALYLP